MIARRNSKLYLSLSLLVVLCALSLVTGQRAAALSGSEFQPGRIIDDSVFFNPNGMSESQIQTFLNSKVPVCDTNGTKPYGGTTRAAYGTSNGNPPPYICLKDYRQDTTSKPFESGICNGHIAGNKSATRIIKEVAESCSINPKVLLTLLQKEQSLVTDDWPWFRQYRSATGYGCPDTAPCDAQYYGFFNQVYNAARIYKVYAKSPNSFNHLAGRNNNILYHPNSACGRGTVFIQNQATAGLYNYTPYQPNAAALNNLYGLGDGCSAYGNRNFWRMFNDWFGSTQLEVPYAWAFESLTAHLDSARTVQFTEGITLRPGDKVYLTVRARNIGNETWDPSFLRLGTWGPQDRLSAFYDSSWPVTIRPASLKESAIGPGQTGTFQFILTAPQTTGSYREFFNLVAEGRTWLNDQSLHFDIDVVEPIMASNSANIDLKPGQTLNRGQYLLSPDRHNVLILQGDGNLVLYSNFKAVWWTGTVGYTSDRLVLQEDGNLVLYDKTNRPLWNSETYGNSGTTRLVMQTDGNLVLYGPSNAALWATYTIHRPDHLSHVNYRISSTILYQGQQLETANRKYKLVLQEDGNLVLYSDKRALWATYTNGKIKPYLVVQGDGNLVLYDVNGKAIWYSNTSGQGVSHLIMQADGNLVMYNSNNRATWNTATQGQE